MNRTTLQSLLIIIFSCFLLLGCNNKHHSQTVYFGIAQKPQTLDPRFSSDAASERLNNLIYTPLIFFNDDFSISSNILEINKISSKIFSFTLKKNPPKFHDGEVMGVDDIIATINHLIGLKTSPFSYDLREIKQIKKISNIKFEVYLSASDHNFLTKLSFSILPKSLIEKDHNFASNPIGSGPFEFLSAKPNISVRRVLDGQVIEFVEIKDPTVRVLKLVNGEIDILQNDLPLELMNYLMEHDTINCKLTEGVNVSYIGFNFKDPLLKNVKVRQALSLAIDRTSIVNYFFNTKTRLATQILPPEHWASQDLKMNEYNPSKAREILSEIYPNKLIHLTYKTSTDPFRLKIATIIQAQLADVGINLIIKTLDWGTYFSDIQSGNFQLYGLTWVGIRNPEIYEKIFSSKFIPPLGLNRGGYSDPSMDLYLNEAKMSNDWSDVIHTAYKKIGYIPLWYEGNFVAHKNYISNFEIYPNGNWDGLTSVRKVL